MILTLANRYVKNSKMSYEKFNEVYSFLSRKEQYEVVDILFKNGIELVDEDDVVSVKQDDDALDLINDEVFKDAYDDNDDELTIINNEIHQSNPILCTLIQQGSKQAEQDLCTKNQKLIYKIASIYHKAYKCKLDIEDLEQVGYMGMLKAAKRFDISQGYEFSTYATWWIRQTITREIMDHGSTIRIPVHMVENINKVIKAERDYLDMEFQEKISAISEQLEMSEELVKRCFELKKFMNVNSLDKAVGEDGLTELVELLPCEDEEPIETIIIRKDLRSEFDKIFLELSEREADVVKKRFGWNDDEEKTLEEIGLEYGVTRERIRQIEAKAIRRIQYRAFRRKMKNYLH